MEKISASRLLLLLMLMFVLELEINLCVAINASSGCVAAERKALLKFKASLVDPTNRLSSWRDLNCCTWEGVTCDQVTGHVIKLDLRGNVSFDDYTNKAIFDDRLVGKSLDPSLRELKYLNYLDLSQNKFQGSRIPEFLGSMTELQYLNLSGCSLDGVVPDHLGNLSKLRRLDLNYNDGLISNDIGWVSNFSSLEYLDLSWVNLSQTNDLVKVLNVLPSLSVLRLSRSSLNNHLSHSCLNSSFLSHVYRLDLSSNRFHGEVPCFISNMTSLRILGLSNNVYNTSHLQFLKLRNLVHLNLGWNQFEYESDWISQLLGDNCRLESLSLSYNHFHGEISSVFNNISGCWSQNLKSLELSGNNFKGGLPNDLDKVKRLTFLRFSFSNISGEIPESLGNLSGLEELDISFNKLVGLIPSSFRKLKALRWLSLFSNQLSGEIPESLGNLSGLEELDISFNKLVGLIPSSFRKLKALRWLRLSSNQLSGQIPESLGNLSGLEVLDISFNKLVGLIPSSFRKLKALRWLSLSSNQLSGEIPIFLGQLSNLERLGISDNLFNGTISEVHFDKLSKLKYFDVSSNSINFKFGHGWVPSFQLNFLFMGSSDIGGQFPSWLQSQKTLVYLNLSNCGISGTLPSDIGYMLPLLNTLLMSRNSINGSLPDSLCNMRSLQVIDLSNNNLSGNMSECWQKFQGLKFLSLSSNELSGTIPKSIGGAGGLQWLLLNNNMLSGPIPSTLQNCTYLEALDVGENMLSGKIPAWIGNMQLSLFILKLRNNQFHGEIPRALCEASQLQVLDLGNNKLSGYIPHCFGNLSGMIEIKYPLLTMYFHSLYQVFKGSVMEYSRNIGYLVNLDLSCNNLSGKIPLEMMNLRNLYGLNLSHNSLDGEIPAKIGDMTALESLDLSSNNLFGRIPNSLSNLYFLSHLNVSNNNLSGQIPTGKQLQTLGDHASYDGNPQLCGAPLQKRCPGENSPNASNVKNHVEQDGDSMDKIWFCAFVVGGFGTGFWGFVGLLVFKRSFRQAYFGFTDELGNKILLATALLRRRISGVAFSYKYSRQTLACL
ncbi:receptor-like protein EIX2 isoform X1 [Andrographis paniculata]|uniref:receptor-like protein EIX2 isoform X1 n=1 Tax=Andrographis paniculata TaxID=175694 RepID=UPI0021E6EBD2|nr:receptor-like protein EIX2 isoform X1 [Andrographis paniculata]